MAKIVFLETREVKDHRGVVVERFEAGAIYELNPASAKWWILQRCAEAVPPDPAPAAKAPAPVTPAPAAAPAEARQSGRARRPTAVATEGTGEDGGYSA